MRAGGGAGRTVRAGRSVESLIPMMLDDPEPLDVVDDAGRSIGTVDRAVVSALLTRLP
jgi:hypothetical protein